MKETPRRLAIPCKDGFIFRNTGELMYCLAEGNYSTLYFNDGKRYMISKTLKTIQDLLEPELFVRIHQAHVVNLNYVVKYQNSKINTVRMTNGEELAVSRRKKGDMMDGVTFL